MRTQVLSGDEIVDKPSMPWAALSLLVLAFTLLNAIKPLHIDDTFILRVAQQIVASPLDPYGFDIFWLQWPQPVYEELTPPVLPYWWAAGLALLGDSPFLWKLWLLPFAAMFVGSLYLILRRFAPGVELPVVAMTVFSPAFLPSFNLMQDVPALALALTALAIFLRAADRGSAGLALVAGVAAALAMQTKYTALAVLGAVLVYGVLRRRWWQTALALGVAAGLFASWELAMTRLYGQGMLIGQVKYGQFWYERWNMILPMMRLIGGTVPAVALLVLHGLGVPRALTGSLAVLMLGAYGSLAVFAFNDTLFTGAGAVVLAAVAWCALASMRQGLRASSQKAWGLPVAETFLVCWLLIEVAMYFATAPFPAVRRVMGIVVVATLLAARLVSQRVGARKARGALAWIAVAAMLLGLGYFFVDLREAEAQRDSVAGALGAIEQAGDAPSTIWYVGHWGFQYYAEQAGMRPVVPDSSRLEAGDWLVVPSPVHQQEILIGDAQAAHYRSLEVRNFPALGTGYGFYGGSSPLTHLSGPRLETRIYRVRQDWIPVSAWSPRQVLQWAMTAGGRTAAATVPALVRMLDDPRPATRGLAARGLAELGPRAEAAVVPLTMALDDPDANVRMISALALGFIGEAASFAVPQLEDLIEDPEPTVQEAAARALDQISRLPPGGS